MSDNNREKEIMEELARLEALQGKLYKLSGEYQSNANTMQRLNKELSAIQGARSQEEDRKRIAEAGKAREKENAERVAKEKALAEEKKLQRKRDEEERKQREAEARERDRLAAENRSRQQIEGVAREKRQRAETLRETQKGREEERQKVRRKKQRVLVKAGEGEGRRLRLEIPPMPYGGELFFEIAPTPAPEEEDSE